MDIPTKIPSCECGPNIKKFSESIFCKNMPDFLKTKYFTSIFDFFEIRFPAFWEVIFYRKAHYKLEVWELVDHDRTEQGVNNSL